MPDEFNLEAKLAAWKCDVAKRLRDREVAEEMETHVRDLFEAAVAAGSPPEEAWRCAVERFGDSQELQREFGKLNRFAWLDASAILVVGMIALGLILPLTQLILHQSPQMQADHLLGAHVWTISLGYISAVCCGLLGTYAVLRIMLGGAKNAVLDRWIPLGVVAVCGLESVLILTGLVLGAVWASEHLGRAWGWDVKEVAAAAVTLFHAIVFTLAVRRRIANELLLALASIGATLTLCAWFGPHAFGAALQAYGFPGFTLLPLLVAAAISTGVTVLAVRGRRQVAE